VSPSRPVSGSRRGRLSPRAGRPAVKG
jgi:hypothetical protein